MLIIPQLSLSLRCPCCQERILYRTVSRFELAHGNIFTVCCSCGAAPMHLRIGDKYLYADVFCPCCEEAHFYIFPFKSQQSEPPFIMNCENMDIRLACLGALDDVRIAMDEESALILDYKDELQEYFVRPSIIGRSLLRLNQLLATHACFCATCNREDMDILILSDRLVLSCPHCSHSASLFASRPADLHLLNKISRISLADNGMRIRYQ